MKGPAAAAAGGGGSGSGSGGMPHPTVLRHACYVYSAAFHPVQRPGSALVATGGYDGTVRLWRRYTGELLAAVKMHQGCINSLCFDKLGTRLYSADSVGVLQEFSCDVSKGAEAQAAAPGATNLDASMLSAGGQLNASMLPGAALLLTATARASAGGAAAQQQQQQLMLGSGSVGSGGADSAQQQQQVQAQAHAAALAAASSSILRVLRTCDEFDGEPLSHVFLHHSGRRLGVVTKRSRLLVLETKSLGRAQQFLGVRCREAPLKAAFSPDGRVLVCGSEDGRVVVWDADGGPPTQLPQWGLGGNAVYQVAWNPQFHMAAVCSFAAWAPVLLLAHDPRVADVALQQGPKTPLDLMGRDKRKNAAETLRAARWDVPDRLTPELLRHMLQGIRRDALERGVLTAEEAQQQQQGGHGDKLVVPYNRLHHLRQEASAPTTPTPQAAAAPKAAQQQQQQPASPLEASFGLPRSRFTSPAGSVQQDGPGTASAQQQQRQQQQAAATVASQSGAVARELLQRSMRQKPKQQAAPQQQLPAPQFAAQPAGYGYGHTPPGPAAAAPAQHASMSGQTPRPGGGQWVTPSGGHPAFPGGPVGPATPLPQPPSAQQQVAY